MCARPRAYFIKSGYYFITSKSDYSKIANNFKTLNCGPSTTQP